MSPGLQTRENIHKRLLKSLHANMLCCGLSPLEEIVSCAAQKDVLRRFRNLLNVRMFNVESK
jgi:hypothetical protein